MWTWCKYVNVDKDPQGSEWITHSRPPRARDSLSSLGSLFLGLFQAFKSIVGTACKDASRRKKKKNEGWGRFRSLLSPSPSFPPYFFLALAKLHYPNAWIRLVSRGHFKLITQGKLKKPIPSSAETWIIFTNMPCQFFFCRLSRKINILESIFFTKQELITLGKS